MHTTTQVAELLGIKKTTLIQFINRNPEFKAANKPSTHLMLWTDDEINRLRERRNNKKKPGAKPRMKVEPESEVEEPEDNTEPTETTE